MKRINELLVVEGKRDSANLKRYFDVATLESGGSNISKEFLALLKNQNRTIVIFTDPDSNGKAIRQRISQEIAGCLHAYLPAEACRNKNKVGIQYAAKEDLEQALNNLVSYTEVIGTLKMSDLWALKLSGTTCSKARRHYLSNKYHLGDCNGKSLLRALNALSLTYKTLEEDLKHV